MTLLNPAALALLLFSLLLIFRRQRQARARVPVSNLYLWKEAAAADTTALTRRIRRHWLLILQVGVLAATAGALARPVWTADSLPVAVIVDASVSMGARQGDGSRADLARARAVDVLSTLPSRTRVRVIGAGPAPVAAGESRASDRAVDAALRDVRPTDGAADVQAAIEFARAADPRPGRIYVFSDADAVAVRGATAADVEWIPVGERMDNAGITTFSARRLPSRDPGLDGPPATATADPGLVRVELLVGIANHGAAIDGATLTISRGGSAVARRTISVSAQGQATFGFITSSNVGVLTATLDHDDALAADNHRTLVVFEQPIPVSLRYGPGLERSQDEPSRGGFLEKALAAHPDVVRVSDADAAAVVICDACTEPPAGNHNVLLIAPRDGPSQPPAPILTVTPEHPLADGLELDGVSGIVTAMGGNVDGPGTVIAQAGGTPALIAYESDTRRVVELRIDPDNGLFPYSAAFPVLVANALDWLAGDASLELTAGEPLRWRIGSRDATPEVFGPDGGTVPSTLSRGILSSTDTAAAGLYRVRIGSGERLVAVNPATDGESNLATPVAPRVMPATTQSFSQQAATDASAPLVLAALALLLLEWRYRVHGPLRAHEPWRKRPWAPKPWRRRLRRASPGTAGAA